MRAQKSGKASVVKDAMSADINIKVTPRNGYRLGRFAYAMQL